MHHLTVISQAPPFQMQSCLIGKMPQFLFDLFFIFRDHLSRDQRMLTSSGCISISVTVLVRMHAGDFVQSWKSY